MSQLIEAVRLHDKWKEARDAAYGLLTMFGREPEEERFKPRMKWWQLVIKGYAQKHSMEIIPAMTALANEVGDGMTSVIVLAAGYELSNDKDYTSDETIIAE